MDAGMSEDMPAALDMTSDMSPFARSCELVIASQPYLGTSLSLDVRVGDQTLPVEEMGDVRRFEASVGSTIDIAVRRGPVLGERLAEFFMEETLGEACAPISGARYWFPRGLDLGPIEDPTRAPTLITHPTAGVALVGSPQGWRAVIRSEVGGEAFSEPAPELDDVPADAGVILSYDGRLVALWSQQKIWLFEVDGRALRFVETLELGAVIEDVETLNQYGFLARLRDGTSRRLTLGLSDQRAVQVDWGDVRSFGLAFLRNQAYVLRADGALESMDIQNDRPSQPLGNLGEGAQRVATTTGGSTLLVWRSEGACGLEIGQTCTAEIWDVEPLSQRMEQGAPVEIADALDALSSLGREWLVLTSPEEGRVGLVRYDINRGVMPESLSLPELEGTWDRARSTAHPGGWVLGIDNRTVAVSRSGDVVWSKPGVWRGRTRPDLATEVVQSGGCTPIPCQRVVLSSGFERVQHEDLGWWLGREKATLVSTVAIDEPASDALVLTRDGQPTAFAQSPVITAPETWVTGAPCFPVALAIRTREGIPELGRLVCLWK